MDTPTLSPFHQDKMDLQDIFNTINSQGGIIQSLTDRGLINPNLSESIQDHLHQALNKIWRAQVIIP